MIRLSDRDVIVGLELTKDRYNMYLA